MTHPLQHVLANVADPRNITSAGGALYLTLFKDDATRMGWLNPVWSKRAADVASATKIFLSDVSDGVKCFRTDNSTELINETFARLCSDEKIRYEHNRDRLAEKQQSGRARARPDTGVGMAACLEPPRLFPGQIQNLDRYWVEAAVYMNDGINTTATAANPHFKSPQNMYLGKLPPANTCASMQPGFRRIGRTQTWEPMAELCFYLSSGPNHLWDCVKTVTLFGRTSNTRDVTWEAENMMIIAAEPNVGAATTPET